MKNNILSKPMVPNVNRYLLSMLLSMQKDRIAQI
jgi:hypothetical protein